MNGRIKGASVRQVAMHLVRTLSREDLRRTLEPLVAAHPTLFDLESPTLGVLASTWYPAGAVHQFIDVVCGGMTVIQRRALADELAYATMSELMRGAHRAILRIVGSPDLHARFVQRLWDTHFDNGKVRVERRAENESLVIRTQWDSHHPFLCEFGAASDRFIFPAMGLDGVRYGMERCISDGDPDCAHWVRWAPTS